MAARNGGCRDERGEGERDHDGEPGERRPEGECVRRAPSRDDPPRNDAADGHSPRQRGQSGGEERKSVRLDDDAHARARNR